VTDMLNRLFLALLIISPASFADWGDVYYCQMTSRAYTNLDGSVSVDSQLETFQFRLDKTQKAMIFGRGSWFQGEVQVLISGLEAPSAEHWFAGSLQSKSYFLNSKFIYALVGNGGITAISADCNKV
jgi:hypothetical protein